jgi:hypothetical protein
MDSELVEGTLYTCMESIQWNPFMLLMYDNSNIKQIFKKHILQVKSSICVIMYKNAYNSQKSCFIQDGIPA